MPGEILGRTAGAQYADGFSAKTGYLVRDPVLLVLHLHAVVCKELPEDHHVLHIHLDTVNLMSRLLTQALGHGEVLVERLLHADRPARFLRECACRRQGLLSGGGAGSCIGAASRCASTFGSRCGCRCSCRSGGGIFLSAPGSLRDRARVARFRDDRLRDDRRHGGSYLTTKAIMNDAQFNSGVSV